MHPRLRLVKLAAGGAATVYVAARAPDAGGELVALKLPHPHVLDDPRQRAALLREAKIASAIAHPNVVRVREVEEHDGGLALVMDYVEGASLSALIAAEADRDSRIPAPIVARIVLDACAGLTAAHAQVDGQGQSLGLVHRDVSPQNILVGEDGVARVTDFGIAKASDAGVPSTTQGTLKGKLGYMAPEYVNRGRIDASGDVFALGVVAWEAFAGRRLFRGDNEAQTLDRVLRDEPPPLASISVDLAPYDAAIAHALAKDAAARTASAEAFAAELSAVGVAASVAEVAAYVGRAMGAVLVERRARIEEERRAIRARVRGRRARIGGLVLVPVLAIGGGAVLLTKRHAAVVDGAPVAVTTVPVAEALDAAPSPSPSPSPSTSTSTPTSPATSTSTPHRKSPPTSPTRLPPPNPYSHPPPSPQQR